MCGIAGIFHYARPRRPVDPEVLGRMTESLAHRGPDGAGTWTAPGVGLGHRRLAIIDLSENGRQPMLDADGELVVTFNGEIYNYRELRQTLRGLGLEARTLSDTEVILLGYRAWGPAMVERLSGIFAFALWDARAGRLFVARDPLGVKPFFYAAGGGSFRFGSEVKAVLSDPEVDRDIDDEAMDAFLTLGYTPAPSTGFAAVRQLLPGQCGFVDEQGLRTWTYWTIPYAEAPSATPFDEAVPEFSRRLEDVTRAQMVSDVPIGAFLSGGLDSAAIVRAMLRAGVADVNALTVGFDVSDFDERSRAQQTAAALGVRLESQVVARDSASLLPVLSRHMEEPTADSSMLAVYLLCQAARRRFTVAMSGDGADEILAGYDTYRATALAATYRRLPRWVRRGVCAPLARRLPATDRKYCLHQVAVRFTEGAELGPGRDHAAWRIIFPPALKRRLYQPEFARRVAHVDAVGGYAAAGDTVPPAHGALARLLHADTTFYLPNDMLVKVDRMSMAHGLEVRVPFLDPGLVAFCANLPADYKLHRGKVRKHILREALRPSIPDEILSLPKSGFNVPIEAWMRGPLRELLLDSVRTHRHELGAFIRPDAVQGVADEHRHRRADHGHALFIVLMLSLWLDNRARAWRAAAVPAGTVPLGRPVS